MATKEAGVKDMPTDAQAKYLTKAAELPSGSYFAIWALGHPNTARSLYARMWIEKVIGAGLYFITSHGREALARYRAAKGGGHA